MNFKTFLINEKQIHLDQDTKYFGNKVGDILSAIHDLEDNAKAIGPRKLMKSTLTLVNQIRSILHDQWRSEMLPYLKVLQRVGVAIMRAIDNKGDLADVLSNAGDELEQMVGGLGVPINQIGTGVEDQGQS